MKPGYVEQSSLFRCIRSWSSGPVVLFLLVVSGALGAGCSAIRFPEDTVGCKTHTYINLVLGDYVKQRFHSQEMMRLAIVPFDVPETFAPPGNESVHYGRELARNFQQELHKVGGVPIVELLNRDRWPGKRADFFSGNYQAVSIARAAGYDFVLVGYLDEIKDANTLSVYVKLIDTQNQITIWHDRTDVVSHARDNRKGMSRVGLAKERPELFNFPERTELLAECTVHAIHNDEPVP